MRASAIETRLIAGHIHLFSKREPLPQKKLLFHWKNLPLSIISRKRGSNQQQPLLSLDMFISPAAKGLNNKLLSLALSITIQQSKKKGSNRQEPLLQLDMLIFPTTEGLSNKLPFFGCTVHRYPIVQHQRALSIANPHAVVQVYYYPAVQKEMA